jgi:septal ring-binding cell division protein DamX
MGLNSIVKLFVWGCISGTMSLLIACAANMDRAMPEQVEMPPVYEPETPPAVAAQAPGLEQQLPSIQYTIQVGAFSAVARASKYADQLARRSFQGAL